MEFFRIHRDIPFMSHALKFNVISGVTFLLAVVFLVLRGLHLNIEFTGGTVIELRYASPPNIASIRARVSRRRRIRTSSLPLCCSRRDDQYFATTGPPNR